MDFKRIDAAVASYALNGDSALDARLNFFRSIWEIQDSYAQKAASLTGCQFDKDQSVQIIKKKKNAHPAQDVFPLLSCQPLNVDRNLMAETCQELSNLFINKGGFDEDTIATLTNFSWRQFLENLPFDLAGFTPADFLDSAMDALEDRTLADKNIKRPGFIITIISLALRSMLDSYAADILEAYKSTCNPEAYQMSHHGCCPVCGTNATASFVGQTETHRGNAKVLWCSQCGSEWEFSRVECPHCGCKNQDHLHYLNIEGDDKHRLYVCDECHGYMRTYFESVTPGDIVSAPFSFEVEDVVMANLDIVARQCIQ